MWAEQNFLLNGYAFTASFSSYHKIIIVSFLEGFWVFLS